MTEAERLNIENSIIFLTQQMLDMYSKKHGISFDQALDKFSRSKTYLGLYDLDTGIFREGPRYLLDFFEAEIARTG